MTALKVVIDFDHATEGDTLHRIRNFGEDLYVSFKDTDKAQVDIHEVDRATDRLTLKILHERHVGSVMATVQKLLGEHFFVETARVSRIE